jgi:hypothetical protein
MPAVRTPREHPAERCEVDGVVAALGRAGDPAAPAGARRDGHGPARVAGARLDRLPRAVGRGRPAARR